MTDPSMLTDSDRGHLRRCVELAQAALVAGDEPFGSVLVDEHGTERFADRNRVAGGDATRHPEFAIARWAAANLTVEERADATVYTSGEHCPMCAAAHAWVGLAGSCTPAAASSCRPGCGTGASRRDRWPRCRCRGSPRRSPSPARTRS